MYVRGQIRRHDDSRSTSEETQRTFVRPASYDDLRVWVQLLPELRAIELLDRFPQPQPPFRRRIMVALDRAQSFFRRIARPHWRGEVHVALAEVDAVWREVHRTGS